MPDDEPLVRRTVRDFMKYYGVARPFFREIRLKENVKPNDWNSWLSVADQHKLLRHVVRQRREDHAQLERARHVVPRPRLERTPPPPRPELDHADEAKRLTDKAQLWRAALHEVARPHLDVTDRGYCPRCKKPAPCKVRRTLMQLDNELVEDIAAWDPGTALGADHGLRAGLTPDARVRHLRWRRDHLRGVLADLAVEHILQETGKCSECGTKAPCDVKRTLERVNRGIAKDIAGLATLSDGEYEAALRRRPERFSDDDLDDGYGLAP